MDNFMEIRNMSALLIAWKRLNIYSAVAKVEFISSL